MPFVQLLWREAVKLPGLLAFFGILWGTHFFTGSEAAAIKARGARLVGRRGRGRAELPGPAAAGGRRGAAGGRGER